MRDEEKVLRVAEVETVQRMELLPWMAAYPRLVDTSVSYLLSLRGIVLYYGTVWMLSIEQELYRRLLLFKYKFIR